MRYFLLLLIICILPIRIHAEDLFPEELLPTISTDPYNTLKGGQYQLELLPFKEEGTQPSPTPQKRQDKLPPKDRVLFEQNGYVVKETEGELKISLSKARISLGSIAGAGVYTGTTDIGITSDQPISYSLLIQQMPSDGTDSKWDFQPTHCDADIVCTSTKAAIWNKKNSYGFGYSVLGLDIYKDFKNESFFRKFSDEIPVIIAKNQKIQGLRSVKLLPKLVTPPSTEEGVYDTNVDIIVLPQ